jgi:hypothetical protein
MLTTQAYDVDERKLKRELEHYGPVKKVRTSMLVSSIPWIAERMPRGVAANRYRHRFRQADRICVCGV